jgi:hypothetical protein
MSRLRTGHKPDDWKPEPPREAHIVKLAGSMAVGVSAAEQTRRVERAYKAKVKPVSDNELAGTFEA